MPVNETSSPLEPARVLPLGDAAATIVFGERIDAGIHERVKAFCAALDAARIPAIREWAPAFASVTVWYDPEARPFADLAESLLRLTRGDAPRVEGSLFALPFCCDADFAPDLEETARSLGLSSEAYVEKLSAVTFEVFMLGFLPGFAYLGGLPRELDAPRLATPRKKVPARSVAIADGMCAAYPSTSPGGWRLIGRTPAPLFDLGNPERPALLAPGDRLRWRRIDRAEFARLETQWAQSFDSSMLVGKP